MSLNAGFAMIVLLLSASAAPDNLIATLPSSYAHYGIAWSPDSSRFVRWQITPVEYPAEVIETSSGTVLYELAIIEDAAWSPDGEYLLVALYDRFDIYAPDWNLVQSIAVQRDWIHPRGGWLAPETVIITSWSEGDTFVYDLATGQVVYNLPNGERADWSWNGEVIATVGESSTESVFIWDKDNGDLIATLRVLAYEVDVSPDGTRVLIDVGDGWEVWSSSTAERLSRLDLPSVGNYCGPNLTPEWSADSTKLLTANILDADTGEMVPRPDTFDPTGGYLEYAPNYTVALTWNYYPGATVWDVTTGDALLTVPHHSIIAACSTSYLPPSLSPDGRYLVMWDSGQPILDPYVNSSGTIVSGPASTTVTVYAQPEVTSAVVAELPENTLVRIIADGESGWWQIVELTSDQTGWVRNDGITSKLYATRSVEPYMQIWRVR